MLLSAFRAEDFWFFLSNTGNTDKWIVFWLLVIVICVVYMCYYRIMVMCERESTDLGNQLQNQHQEHQDASLDHKPIPELRSSFCSRLFFLWLTPLLRISSKKALDKSDVWIAPDYNRAGRVTTETQDLYEEYKVAC